MRHSYSTKKYDKENMARVLGRSLPISTKFSIEICNFIKNRTTAEAKDILKKVVEGKKAIPFKRFNSDLSHKRGIGAGRYPKKPAQEIAGLIESVEANAQFKGLNTSNLYIKHICAHLASRPWRYGRQRRRKTKRTHVEIIVEEKKKAVDKNVVPPKKSSEEKKHSSESKAKESKIEKNNDKKPEANKK